MKIVNIAGGLGNQMFQYAFAISLKDRCPEEEVLIDISHYHTLFFRHYKGANLHNGYEIDTLFSNAWLPKAKWWQIMRLSYYVPNYILFRLVRKILPIRKTELIPLRSKNYSYLPEAYLSGDRYYEGYWQCIRNFCSIKPKLLEIFAPPTPNAYNAELMEQIKTERSVGIHVRRGDYLSEPEFQGICDVDYYRKAIGSILMDKKEHTFYVFSNDMAWCKENLPQLIENNKIMYVTGNKGKDSCWDMFLMSYCLDLVIANSSFSWWGAFLNQRGGRVIAPEPWLNRDCEIDIYDKNWLKL